MKLNTLKLGMIILFLFILTFNSKADVKPAKIFSSNMVLQKGIENTIWGWAGKNEKVSLTLNGQTVKTKAGQDGKWTTKLPAMNYGGPYTLTIKGKNVVTMENVMIGEVWVCSGQSNMEWAVRNTNNAQEEIANANYPNIRLYTVLKKISQFPVADLEKGEWSVCSPETVPGFSAVAYFFGQKIHTDLNVAVGLINTSWGGTVAETWTSPETIKNDVDFKQKLAELQSMNMADYQKSMMDKIKDKLGNVPTKDNGLELKYQSFEFDDSGWKTLHAPQLWESQGYNEIDGIAWYRKSFNLTKEQAEKESRLLLAKIDDSDICWVNGQEVGHTNGYNVDREYKVPAGILKEDKNTIAVKVTDTGGNGGIFGKDNQLALVSESDNVSLTGDWKIRFTEIGKLSGQVGPNDYPTLLFNGMINPILPYGIKGAIWYQGESNADRAKQYQHVFPNMIKDWRTHWGLGDFSFIWVELANFMQPVDQPSESTWAELREAQTMTLSLPNTGFASAIDIGEASDIHPRNKQDVGLRLALNALKISYGKNVVNLGPLYKTMNIDGQQAKITFTETGSGLMVKDKYGYIKGFSIAGADKKFHWAKAELMDDNTVVVYSEEVKSPVAVRYGWANNPDDLNLYNKEGLPADPFRTDNWPGITK